jgi:hypothetical protein
LRRAAKRIVRKGGVRGWWLRASFETRLSALLRMRGFLVDLSDRLILRAWLEIRLAGFQA